MRVATSVHELDRQELFDHGDCLFDQDFLSFVEEEHGGRAGTFYFHDRDTQGLSAFTPGYVYDSPIPFTFRMEDFLAGSSAGDIFRRHPRYLVINTPIRLRSRVLARDPAALKSLLSEIVEWAREQRMSAVVLSFVLGSDELLRNSLDDLGFASSFYEGDFYLPTEATDFDEFLRHLPAEPRKQFHNDINRLARSGLEIEELADVAGHADELARLHHILLSRYGRPDEFTPVSFARFERLVDNSRIVVTRGADGISGFAMSCHGHDVCHLLRYGKRENVDRRARVYGNLVFAESVRHAVALGCRRVHFGKASHRAKTLRGCRYEEGIVYALCMDAAHQVELAACFVRLDKANRQRFAQACHNRNDNG
jgi:predicted N-acyltransferase